MKSIIEFHMEFEPDTTGIDAKEKKRYAEHITRLELASILKNMSDPTSIFTITVEDDGDDHPIPID